jgi:uncharacterized protein
MEIDLTQLEPEGVRVREAFDAGDLDSGTKERLEPSRADIDVWVRPVEGLVRATGTIAATVRAECDRCLKSIELGISGRFDQRYRLGGPAPDAEAETEVDAGDLDIETLERPVLDLAALAREQIELHAPMNVLCDAACKGLCPVCRADRNRVACGCETTTTDPRWDALKDLKLN